MNGSDASPAPRRLTARGAATAHNTKPMEIALDMALGQIKAHLADEKDWSA